MMTPKLFSFLSIVFLCTLSAHAQVKTPPTNVTTGFVHFDDGIRQVTWYYTPGNLVVYDGDVVFGTVTEFDRALINITYNSESGHKDSTHQRRSYPPPSPNSISKRADSVFPGSPRLWPNGLVQYRYFDSNAENALQGVLKSALDIWAHADCIGLKQNPTNSNPKGAPGIVTIQGNTHGYCTASIGYSTTKSLWMSLDTTGACGTGEVLHAIGHLLGLINEQKRPDAYLHDPFHCSHLIDYPFHLSHADANAHCCGHPPHHPCCGYACLFTPEFDDYNIQDPVAADGGAFDLDSVMLFPNNAFAKPGTRTLQTALQSYPSSSATKTSASANCTAVSGISSRRRFAASIVPTPAATQRWQE